MSNNKMFADRRNLLAVVIPVLIILFPIGYSVIAGVFPATPASEPFLEKPDEQYDNCVRDTEYMRFHHWELLKELRDETVRLRKRMDITVADCRKCHSNRAAFCNRCHDSVNLQPDCWGCHYYPDTPEAGAKKHYMIGTESMVQQSR
ncbi:MAG: hypothetical protein ABIA59_11345 [Candidatus Latescibacterota bacterium]